MAISVIRVASWRQTSELFYNEDAFQLMGFCMQIHRELEKEQDKIIFKDAFVVEPSSWQLV